MVEVFVGDVDGNRQNRRDGAQRGADEPIFDEKVQKVLRVTLNELAKGLLLDGIGIVFKLLIVAR